jgi:hypothetical protein
MPSNHMPSNHLRTAILVTAAAICMSAPAAAQPHCMTELTRFRTVVDSDARTGNLNASVYARMQPALRQVIAECTAGRERLALHDLDSLKSRFGYH